MQHVDAEVRRWEKIRMAVLDLRIGKEGAFPELKGKEVIEVEHIGVASLDDGTMSGKPTVSLLIPLPDGRYVHAQTTLALFLTAADALKAAHGDPRR